MGNPWGFCVGKSWVWVRVQNFVPSKNPSPMVGNPWVAVGTCRDRFPTSKWLLGHPKWLRIEWVMINSMFFTLLIITHSILNHFGWPRSRFEAVPVGYPPDPPDPCKTHTHTRENPYPWAWVWVFMGMGKGMNNFTHGLPMLCTSYLELLWAQQSHLPKRLCISGKAARRLTKNIYPSPNYPQKIILQL